VIFFLSQSLVSIILLTCKIWSYQNPTVDINTGLRFQTLQPTLFNHGIAERIIYMFNGLFIAC